MKKHLALAVGVLTALMVGFGLAWVVCPFLLGTSDSISGLRSRVVDSIPGRAVVEFYGERHGVERRLRYLRDDCGTRPLTLDDLSWFIAEKHSKDPKARDEAIRDFIALHNPWETTILSSAKDIPGFRPDQLDPDLRGLSLARVDVQDGKRADTTITVIYAWTQVGGELKRYRFKTQRNFAPYCYSCVTLQTDVGEAWYLE